MNAKLLNQFFAFVKEREAIRVKRATGAPWLVDDPAESAALARLVKDRRARALQLASVDVEHSLCEF